MTEAAEDVDVLIVGAGINGAGLFRDFCEQGLTVAILDKGDFGSGTSAAPSRLIHGGIKYMETGEFRLVAQSTLERNLLLRNAPHCVRPLPTVIPIFSWTKGIFAALRTLFGSTTAPRGRGAVLIKIGLALYDYYGAKHRVMPRHALWSKSRTLSEIPALTANIVAAGTYHDATVIYPERLVLELLQDGLKASPRSTALNYAELSGSDGTVVRFQTHEGALRAFRPKILVNAAGPWIDRVNAALGKPTRLIGGTKGSHIVLDHPPLVEALKGRMLYFESNDGRICLVFPYLGRALVGSTDIPAANPDTVRCEDDEIDYFSAKPARPAAEACLFPEQIVYAYSGIRPLARLGRHGARPDQPRPFRAGDRAGRNASMADHLACRRQVDDFSRLRRGGRRRRAFAAWPAAAGEHPGDADRRRRKLSRPTRPDAVAGSPGQHGRPEPRKPAPACCSTATAPRRWRSSPTRPGGPSGRSAALPTTRWRNSTGSRATSAWCISPTSSCARTALAVTGRLGGRDLEEISYVAASALGWDEARRETELTAARAELTERHRLRA